MTLLETLRAFPLSITPVFNTEIPHREGTSDWFHGEEFTLSTGKVAQHCRFGDFASEKEAGVWTTPDLTPPEQKEFAQLRFTITKQLGEKTSETHERNAQKNAAYFAGLRTQYLTEYLRRKQVSDTYGAKVSMEATRLKQTPEPHLVIPLRDLDQRIWSYQVIYDNGDKGFTKGSRTKGCFHLLETAHHSWFNDRMVEVYLAEGFATAASVQEALGPAAFVVCAFSGNGLDCVARALRTRYQAVKLVICADNDVLDAKGAPRKTNPGLLAAAKAATENGAELRYPVLKEPEHKAKDFNDLLCREGLDEVRYQLGEKRFVESESQVAVASKPKGVSQRKIVGQILTEYGNTLVKQQSKTKRSLFVYKGTHWEELFTDGEDKLKQTIDNRAEYKLKMRDIKAYYEYLVMNCTPVPPKVSLFTPNPFVANFQDCTLHCVQEGTTYRLERRSHAPGDYLTSVLPFNCPDLSTPPPAPKFEAWLKGLWSKDSDQEEKVRLAYQIGGSTLLPMFPCMAFFIGKPNSGKSTYIKLLIKLIGIENCSNVQPCDWHGFAMANMVGKLLNFDLDVDVHKPMQDSMVKKAIDRIPVDIDRKNKDRILAFLPAVHLFAGNALPKTLDGESKAYGRRLIIIQTESCKVPPDFTQDYEDHLLRDEREGIVARMLLGFKDLLNQGGRFSVPQSSHDSVREIETNADPVQQFLDFLKDDQEWARNHKLFFHENARIKLFDLWKIYRDWLVETATVGARLPAGNSSNAMGHFYKAMQKKGFRIVPQKSHREFAGLGVMVSGDTIA